MAVHLDPPLPQSPDIERNVLGAILLDVPGTDQALAALSPAHFFLPQHATIYRRLKEQVDRGDRPDLVVLFDTLTAHGEIDKIAGRVGYISGLLVGIPRVCALNRWVELLVNKASLRHAICVADKIRALAFGANGDTPQVLEEIANCTRPLSQTSTKNKSQIRVVSGSELLQMTVEPRESLVENLIFKPSMNEIFSWRGVGKTWFALTGAHAVATGGTWLKWKASKPRPVLFVDGELDAASLQQRIRHLDSQSERAADNLKLLCCDMQEDPFPHLAGRAAQIMVEDALGDAEFLILDNLSALAPSSNEKEGEDWIAIQAWLLDLRRRGIASLFLHHAGHSGWARGTTRREDLLDLVIELKRPKDYVASEGLRLEVHFTKTRGMMADGAEPIEASLGTDLEGHLRWTWRPLEDKRAAQVVELRKTGHSFREIEKLTDIPRSTAERLYQKADVSR